MPIGVYERKIKDPVDRFMNFIEFEPNTGCWIWIGSFKTNDYGQFKVGTKIDGSNDIVRAHRFSYETFVGPIPDGVKVLHKCDNKSCVNWEHLFLGTTQDNSNDMFLKGRGVKSEKGLPYGVSVKPSGKFRSKIRFEGKFLHLGTFGTPEEASEIALKKKLELVDRAKIPSVTTGWVSEALDVVGEGQDPDSTPPAAGD